MDRQIKIHIIEHEGYRYAYDYMPSPSEFRSSIRYVRSIKIDWKKWNNRFIRKTARQYRDNFDRGYPILYRAGMSKICECAIPHNHISAFCL